MRDQGSNSQTIQSGSCKTEVNMENQGPSLTFGHWIYIHRYPINTSGDDGQNKKAILYSLTEGQYNRLIRDSDKLKDIVDKLQDDKHCLL